jgi:hypothetical protein
MHESVSETSNLIRTNFCGGTDGSLYQIGACVCKSVTELTVLLLKFLLMCGFILAILSF